jgi:hypothetical protein
MRLSPHDPEADERKFQLVAEKAQGVQDDALFSPRPGENIVDLVENEDLDANVTKRVDGAPLGPWLLVSAFFF